MIKSLIELLFGHKNLFRIIGLLVSIVYFLIFQANRLLLDLFYELKVIAF